MKKIIIRVFNVFFCCTCFVPIISCIEDADFNDFKFSQKLMILGYVGSHDEPARVNILGSVPIDSRGPASEVVSDAVVQLMEVTKDEDTLSYPMVFDQQRGFYLTSDSSIAKQDHSYWLLVSIGERSWKSTPTSMSSQSKVNISDPEYDPNRRANLYELEAIDEDEYYSYIIGDYGQGIDLFLTMEYYFFYYKKLRVGPDLSASVYLYEASEVYDPYVYVMQIPHEVDGFLREWELQLDGTDEPDFFTQMLSIPPGNLSGNFLDANNQSTDEVIGVFFSAFTTKHRQN
ncbi:hypothetical protein [Ekhidna sp.]|uniref:hypothetical protein n=1 Tax=Ekhidna sp. TaxID=2608089 RepID=UPI0032999525